MVWAGIRLAVSEWPLHPATSWTLPAFMFHGWSRRWIPVRAAFPSTDWVSVMTGAVWRPNAIRRPPLAELARKPTSASTGANTPETMFPRVPGGGPEY